MRGFSHLAGVLNGTLQSSNGETVTYQLNTALSSGRTSAKVNAVQAESRQQVINDRGLITKVKSKDFLIKVKDLEDYGIKQPRRDDIIVSEDGQKWQVTPPASGLDYFEYSDFTQKLYRIHTKKVKS